MRDEGRRTSDRPSPAKRLSDLVRELCKSSSDSRLAEAAVALADAFDETEASMERIEKMLKEARL